MACYFKSRIKLSLIIRYYIYNANFDYVPSACQVSVCNFFKDSMYCIGSYINGHTKSKYEFLDSRKAILEKYTNFYAKNQASTFSFRTTSNPNSVEFTFGDYTWDNIFFNRGIYISMVSLLNVKVFLLFKHFMKINLIQSSKWDKIPLVKSSL